ncbi:MAG: MFS transporter [Phycisphaerae bacterium]
MRANRTVATTAVGGSQAGRRLLFLGCFIALIATSFGFVIRNFIIGDLQVEFGLSETQKGEILGVGLWPFAISIVLFSLIIDRVGYGKAMIFAFVCHVASAFLTIFATGYAALYLGSFICALANGTVEAVVNPVVATMYPKQKTKMLTILHAGWPGGIVLGGILTLAMGGAGSDIMGMAAWKMKVLLILIPTAVYGVILLKPRWPVHERVVAGVPYRDMLRECGIFGALIVIYMVMMEIGRVVGWPTHVSYSVVALVIIALGIYTRSLGRWMYTFLLLVMILLAITELGTDAWMKELRDPAMKALGLSGGWILIYTATIMMVLRFCIGPIVKVLKPLGVLFVSSLFAAAGLYFLSNASLPWAILITATVYGVGQTYFWPVTLGLVSERFPKGGALTLNAIAGVGMLGVGIIGSPLMGYLQDTRIEENLRDRPAMHAKLVEPKEKLSVIGKYRPLDLEKVAEAEYEAKLYEFRKKAAEAVGAAPGAEEVARKLADNEEYQELVRSAYYRLVRKTGDEALKSHDEMVKALEAGGLFISQEQYQVLAADNKFFGKVTREAKENAMADIAILPLIMAACYLGLILYFKAKGGYRAVELTAEGEAGGEHEVTPEEAVADEEATPSE